MADKRQDVFAEKTRQLYEEAFGAPLDDEDLIAALEEATVEAKERFLVSYFRHAGLNMQELAALRERREQNSPAEARSRRSAATARKKTAGAPKKFKKADNDEWMFNFDD